MISLWHLYGVSFATLTGIGVLGSETFFIGMGIFSFFLGGFGKSRLALCPLLGGTLAGDADWRRNLLGERDRVLDLELHLEREKPNLIRKYTCLSRAVSNKQNWPSI